VKVFGGVGPLFLGIGNEGDVQNLNKISPLRINLHIDTDFWVGVVR